MMVRLTKLRPPVAKAGVPRGDLIRMLGDPAKRLTLVCAPAGFGKTTLMTGIWNGLAARDRPRGWISVDDGDNDVVAFVAHLLYCLRASLPDFGTATAALLESGLQGATGAIATALQNDLITQNPEFDLFLDDFHLVSNPEVVELVNRILYAPLSNFHVVIATRANDSLPLARLRVLGDLQEVTAEALKFSLDDAREFLAAATDTALSEDDVAMLHARTEGWVAGLQLAAIALNSGQLSARSVREFTGDRNEVTAFLADEVFRVQPPEVRNFLERTAVLPRFCASLCDALTGRTDSARLLETLQRANLFIFSLDPRGEWFRYHHLFSDFLIARLRKSDPALETELHVSASRWFAAAGETQEAIEHALAGRDTGSAAAMLDAASRDLFANGRTVSLNRYIEQLPVAVRNRLPRLQLVRAWDLSLSWNFESAQAALDTVRASLDDDPSIGSGPDRFELESLYRHRLAMLDLCRDRLEAAIRGGREWLADWVIEDPFMVAAAEAVVLLAAREMYSLEFAEARDQELREQCLAGGAPYGTVFIDSILGRTYCAMGDLDRAERTLRRARDTAFDLHGVHSELAAMPSSNLAEVLYEKNAIDGANELLETYRDVAARLGFLDNILSYFLTRARIAFARDEVDEGERWLTIGESVAERRRFPRLATHICAERIRVLIACGDVPEAIRRFEEFGHDAALAHPQAGAQTMHEVVALAASRLARARNNPRDVIPVIAAWLRFTRRRGAWRSAIRLAIELALLRAQAGDEAAAYRDLKNAIEWAEPRGFVRVFLDEGADMAALLEGFVDRLGGEGASQAHRFAIELLAGFGPGRASATTPEDESEFSGGVTETLTEREVEILRLALDGYVNREIAASLLLSEATVKWYWRRILKKMGVARRAEAVRAARRRGLVREG